MSATDDSALEALQVPNRRVIFRVVFEVFPSSDDAMAIGSKTIRESLDTNIGRAFHQRVSEVFTVRTLLLLAGKTSWVRRVTRFGVTLQGTS